MEGKALIIAGVSGSGKSTVSDRIMKGHSEIVRSIAITTRTPRPGEQFGVHYFFANQELFSWLIQSDQILEYTQVYQGDYYGTLKLTVDKALAEGKTLLFVVDSKGVEQITQYIPEARVVFLKAPDEAEQRRRLEKRGTIGQELEIRVGKAKEELAWAEHRGLPIIINDELERTVADIEAIFFS